MPTLLIRVARSQEDAGYPIDNVGNFTTPTHRVRDTIEQIDTARLLIEQYPDTFELTLTAAAWRKAIKRGKIGGMIGIEGCADSKWHEYHEKVELTSFCCAEVINSAARSQPFERTSHSARGTLRSPTRATTPWPILVGCKEHLLCLAGADSHPSDVSRSRR